MSSKLAFSVISLNSRSLSASKLTSGTFKGSVSSSESYSPLGLDILTSSSFGVYCKNHVYVNHFNLHLVIIPGLFTRCQNILLFFFSF